MRRLVAPLHSEVLTGIPGSRKNHDGAPYCLTEEFVAVYRMHPLIPDDFAFRSSQTHDVIAEKTFRDIAGPAAPRSATLSDQVRAAVDASGQTTVYASWNGSTETSAWELLAGPKRTSLSPVSITPRTGFETAIATTAAGPFYEVRALDASGRVLKTSAVIRVQT